mmetsp:Transcript_16396/g.18692  ORF Transcript_16396/g.18692 Transcript_16396/m.18692 type:complete len:633 (+) Transcript_16396:125-2023(+)
MGSLSSKLAFISRVTFGMACRLIFGWNPIAWQGDSKEDNKYKVLQIPSFLKDNCLVTSLQRGPFKQENLNLLGDDQLIKICRQLEFWYSDGDLKNQNEEMIKLAERLVDQSLWHQRDLPHSSSEIGASSKVPKVRFGKTELQMPVITCGGMRFQNSWLPDFVPILRPSRNTVLSSDAQNNVKNCIRSCLALGINHFETARFYGTSEYQIVDALYELIQNGEIKREDFILQTKIPGVNTKKFNNFFNQSWANIKDKLGYIDLLSIHAISFVNEATHESLAICENLKKEGKIRHIGFSTHATSEQIMELLNTEKFDYVNLHYHYFGSYHGSGTPDTMGGEGNLACVKRALELDMGVFQISPFDKGGKLYRPSKQCALSIGKEMTPMEFAAIYAWRKAGIHTSSVGLARPSDLDEVMSAARLINLEAKGEIDIDKLLDETTDRLNIQFEEKVGKEWAEKGLLNIPSCYDESTDGIAIGQILYLHNLLTGFGMYEFCKDRYRSLESTKWDKKKSFKQNCDKMSDANAGRSFDENVDLSQALKQHYNPELVMSKLREVHNWLSSKKQPTLEYSDHDLSQMGFQKGYNLTVWMEVPGELDSTALGKLLLQHLTGGRMGFVTGPGHSFRMEAEMLRSSV